MNRIGIVVSEFNYDITYLMLQKAIEHAKFLDLEIAYVYRVPGTFEIPYGVKQLIKREDVDGVVALGAVIKGETKHDEVISHQAVRKLLDLMVEYDKPIGLGIIGPGASRAQALERVEDYSRRAVESVAKLLKRRKALLEKKYGGETIFIE